MPKIVDKDAKRLELVEAAARIFARDGLAAAKMADVAVAAGVGKGTVYEYFDSKADLFWAVCENLVLWPEDAKPFTADPETGFAALIGALVQSYDASESFYVILLDYWSAILREKGKSHDAFLARASTLYDGPRALLLAVIEAGKARGVFVPAADPMIAASIAIAGIEGLRSQRIQDPAHLDFNRCLAALTAMLLGYLKGRTA